MIKPNELRIGNYYLMPILGEIVTPSKEYKQVGEIDCFGNVTTLENGTVKPEILNCQYIFPIDLNEEWLSRLGFFHKQMDEDNTKRYELVHIDNMYGSIDIIETSPLSRIYRFNLGSDANPTVYIREIKYVHQLQNIYFALTDIELELK